jgi:hypothetical protein
MVLSVIEDKTEGADAPAPTAGRRQMMVAWAVASGVVLAVFGLADGLVMALRTRVAPCPDGKYFPEGTTDFDCYVHPQAGVGVGIATLSVLLGILIVLCGTLASASLTSRRSTD